MQLLHFDLGTPEVGYLDDLNHIVTLEDALEAAVGHLEEEYIEKEGEDLGLTNYDAAAVIIRTIDKAVKDNNKEYFDSNTFLYHCNALGYDPELIRKGISKRLATQQAKEKEVVIKKKFPERDKEIVKMLETHTKEEVAQHFGLKIKTLWGICNPRPAKAARRIEKIKATEQKHTIIDQALKMIETHSVKEVSKQFGIDKDTLSSWLPEGWLRARQKAQIKENYSKIFMMLETHTIPEVALFFNKKESSIRSLITKYRSEIRLKSTIDREEKRKIRQEQKKQKQIERENLKLLKLTNKKVLVLDKHKERNELIVAALKTKSRAEVAQEFGLSADRIGWIVRALTNKDSRVKLDEEKQRKILELAKTHTYPQIAEMLKVHRNSVARIINEFKQK